MQDIEKIYEQYFKTVNKYLFCLTHNDDISEELTQETFYRAIKNIKSFRGDCKVSTWLCQIAKYTFWQYLDKSKKYKQVPLDELMNVSAGELVEEMYIKEETNKVLYESIEKLDAQTKDVVLFRLTGELSFKEIGELLNKTENWARVTFYRAKAKIGKEMSNYE